MEPTYLVCLPFAGAGASFFRGWQRQAPEDLTILPVQLPGREERFNEAPYTEVARAAEAACTQVLARIDGATPPVALFGHSLGAVLAYELANHLANGRGVTPERLFVSGSPGPHDGREAKASGLSDDEFLARVREFSGYTHPALEDPEMRSLLLPVIRADVEMHETYEPATDKPLPVPVTALRGRDDELVDGAQLAQWEQVTSAGFRTAELDGGHMYLADDPAALLGLITDELSEERT
ncbi:thioesterase [Nonomuraea longispora]|uniref:Thioesterase n=1 Tax=Nonomuraea longispora TaxID=1848320 RepID=A0A4R4N7G5_9ACTN|nr:alpha/beta fold hydrolase [Nonomuraea longispora]TDC04735.1 thioesterase [Nonomuraea longispora]